MVEHVNMHLHSFQREGLGLMIVDCSETKFEKKIMNMLIKSNAKAKLVYMLHTKYLEQSLAYNFF